jgi:phosphonate transport system substrate-binding protein
MQRAAWLLLCLLALPAGPARAAQPPPPGEQGQPAQTTLVLAKVSDNPRKHYKRLRPILDYVVARMGDLGVRRGRLLFARSNRQMLAYLRARQVDWITETPVSAMLFVEAGGARVLLHRRKKGQAEYRTVFITRKDSGITHLTDLVGRRIAFEDPGSTSAFFRPAATLLAAGVPLARLATPRDPVPAGRAGYAFAAGEVNIATWVHKGLVDAGAYNGRDWTTDDHTPRAFRDDLTIFHTTEPLPRALELVRGDLDPALAARLEAILLAAHRDREGRRALDAYQETERLEPLDAHIVQGLERARAILHALPDAMK